VEKQTPYFDNAFKNFWYDAQLYDYIKQFMAIFSGMYVREGKNSLNSVTDLIEIPIRYAGVDRVVDSILAKNTQNAQPRVPMFSAKLIDLQRAPERAKGVGSIARRPYLPRGGALPNDIKVVYRRTPQPYKMVFELNILTSNDLQKFQILEQILPVFDPSIQIQTSDDPFDGGKITILTMENIGFEENYPAGNDRKINMTSIIFSCYGWLEIPLNFKQNFIKSIELRLQLLTANESFAEGIEEAIDNPDSEVVLTTLIDGSVVENLSDVYDENFTDDEPYDPDNPPQT
jgi:hypothetical protein